LEGLEVEESNQANRETISPGVISTIRPFGAQYAQVNNALVPRHADGNYHLRQDPDWRLAGSAAGHTEGVANHGGHRFHISLHIRKSECRGINL
jgi:hypothetical protein